MNVEALVKAFIALLTPLLPFVGSSAEATTERLVTVPQADVLAMTKGMSPADQATALSLGHAMAHSIAAFVTFVASRGKIQVP